MTDRVTDPTPQIDALWRDIEADGLWAVVGVNLLPVPNGPHWRAYAEEIGTNRPVVVADAESPILALVALQVRLAV